MRWLGSFSNSSKQSQPKTRKSQTNGLLLRVLSKHNKQAHRVLLSARSRSTPLCLNLPIAILYRPQLSSNPGNSPSHHQNRRRHQQMFLIQRRSEIGRADSPVEIMLEVIAKTLLFLYPLLLDCYLLRIHYKISLSTKSTRGTDVGPPPNTNESSLSTRFFFRQHIPQYPSSHLCPLLAQGQCVFCPLHLRG
jgi:hypothetical protein